MNALSATARVSILPLPNFSVYSEGFPGHVSPRHSAGFLGEMKKPKPTHGGARQGAGPKKKSVTRPHTMRVTADEKKLIEDLRLKSIT